MEPRKGFKRELWLGFGIIGGSFLLAGLALYYFSGDFVAQAGKIAEERAAIRDQNVVLNTLAQLKNDAAEAAPYLAAMQQLLPPNEDLIGFPKWIGDRGAAHNVDARASFSGNNTPGSPATPAADGFTLTATGTADNIAAFLKDAESEYPGFIIAIDTFELSDSGSQFKLSAVGRVFSRISSL